MIIKYSKTSDATTTYQLALGPGWTELCTLDGETYVHVPDGDQIVDPPAEIAASIEVVTLDDALRNRIITTSDHCLLIDERMRQKIREVYDLETELKYARIGVGAAMGMYQPPQEEVSGMMAFGAHVEAVRQWGRDERAKLGL